MSRTFFVRFNIDAFRSCLADLDGQPDSAYREWMRGFNRGVNGKQPTDEVGALRAGMAMGWESFTEAQDYRAKQAEKGRQSADARRVRQGTAQPTANHGLTMVQPRIEPDTEPEAEPSNIEHPTSTNKQPSTNSSSDKSDMSGFESWWNAYGKKVGKKTAVKEWSKLTPEDRDAAMRATPAYVAWKSDPQYRKDPERFLKHRHWEDQIPDHTPADPKEDPDYDPFMDGAITDPDEVRRLLGYSNER